MSNSISAREPVIRFPQVANGRAQYNRPEAIRCVGSRIAGVARTRRCVDEMRSAIYRSGK